MLESKSPNYKKNHVRKYHLIFFFCNFIKGFFFFSKVLYERSCSKKGATQGFLKDICEGDYLVALKTF